MRTVLAFLLIVATARSADLTVYYDNLAHDQWNVMTYEALVMPLDELQARQPAATEYIAKMKALREELKIKVLSLDEARLNIPTPAYKMGSDEPRLIRTDAMVFHVLLLEHLRYLCQLYEHDAKRLGWKQSNDSPTRWLLRREELAAHHDGTMTTEIKISRWYPAVEPVPAPPLYYRWTRTITIKERGNTVATEVVTFEGSREIDILMAMDCGTGIVLRAVDTANKNRAQIISNWVMRQPGQKAPTPPPCDECPM